MDPRDRVALKQLALRNALLSKKTKIEARRERLLGEMNRLVTERRALESKITVLDVHMKARGDLPPAALQSLERSPSPPPLAVSPVAARPLPDADRDYKIPDGPTPPPPPRPPETVIRDQLVVSVQKEFREADFGVPEFLDLMNRLAPDAAFKLETASRVVNDLLSRRVIKQVSQRMTEKGLVRRFKAV